jgi:hypothetical protein
MVVAAAVVAYAGQVAATVQMSAPSGPQPCGTPITITAVVQETGGALIEDQPVDWSFVSGNVTGDTILTATSTTNASGVATTRVQFACSPHGVVLGATADDVTGTVAVTVSGEGLPRTDTAPASSLPAMLLAALAVIAGSGTILRRLASDRR